MNPMDGFQLFKRHTGSYAVILAVEPNKTDATFLNAVPVHERHKTTEQISVYQMAL
jgi:hypothetical protein